LVGKRFCSGELDSTVEATRSTGHDDDRGLGQGDLGDVSVTPTVPQLRLRSTMAGECKSTRKRTHPDENIDTSTIVSPHKRKRQATGPSRSSTTTAANTSSESTPEPPIVQSPYFSPPKKTQDKARRRRLLEASRSLLNENSRFIKRPSATASPAEPAVIRGRDRSNVAETTAAITEHLVSELSKVKFGKRKTRRDPVPPQESSECFADGANLTAFEKQVRVRIIYARFSP